MAFIVRTVHDFLKCFQLTLILQGKKAFRDQIISVGYVASSAQERIGWLAPDGYGVFPPGVSVSSLCRTRTPGSGAVA